MSKIARRGHENMKKVLIVLLLCSVVASFAACEKGDSDTVSQTNAPGAPQTPTMDDLKKYDEILAYLNSDYNRPETELIEELAPNYGMSTEELQEYVNWVMPYATGLKDIAEAPEEPDFIALISYAETAIEDITNEDVTVSVRESDWDIDKTLLRYVMKSSSVKIADQAHDVIIKLEFDRTYETYSVLQLKIDGNNIDL
jgi:hypothetical protein